MIYLNQAAPALRKIRKIKQWDLLDRLGPVYNRVQEGRGLASNLAKARLELGLTALGSEFGRRLINKGIDNIPNIFKFGASKIKNKNVRRAIQSDIADMVVKEAQSRARNKYDNLFEE